MPFCFGCAETHPAARGKSVSSITVSFYYRVGQPILAAAGFQPALAEYQGSPTAQESRLKGGCRQECPPHNACGISYRTRLGREPGRLRMRHFLPGSFVGSMVILRNPSLGLALG